MSKKSVKLLLKNGLEIKTPVDYVERIEIPKVEINGSFFHLKLIMKEYEKQLEEIKRKFKL